MSEINRLPLPVGAMRLLALTMLAFKLVLVLITPVFMDEAYYFLWGQHPDLSYFDHPPLNAWLQGIAGAVLGWNVLAVRFWVLVSLVADLALLWLFARRLAPDRTEAIFWLSVLVFVSTPIFFGLTGVALPDHLLIVSGLAALYGFVGFLMDWGRGGRSFRLLYLGAVALGLAGLAKYNAALLGVGLVLYVMAVPQFRPLLARPQFWLAAAIALAMQLPVVAWNLQHGLVSFEFILGGRHGGLSDPAGFSGITGFFFGMVGLLGPLLLVPLCLYLIRPAAPGTGLGKAVFLVSSILIFVISNFSDVLFHWNLVAYVGVLPFLALHLTQRWVLIGQLLYGVAAGILALVNFSIVPVMALVSYTDQATAWSYGWGEVAAAVRAARAGEAADFVAGTDYPLASQLAFALGDRDVTSLDTDTEAFDFWFRAAPGADAIIVADDWRPLTDAIRAQFGALEQIEQIEITRQGRHVNRYTIYRARDFVGQQGAPILPGTAPGG